MYDERTHILIDSKEDGGVRPEVTQILKIVEAEKQTNFNYENELHKRIDLDFISSYCMCLYEIKLKLALEYIWVLKTVSKQNHIDGGVRT